MLAEIDQIITEIDAIKERTKFNEIQVLKGIGVYGRSVYLVPA